MSYPSSPTKAPYFSPFSFPHNQPHQLISLTSTAISTHPPLSFPSLFGVVCNIPLSNLRVRGPLLVPSVLCARYTSLLFKLHSMLVVNIRLSRCRSRVMHGFDAWHPPFQFHLSSFHSVTPFSFGTIKYSRTHPMKEAHAYSAPSASPYSAHGTFSVLSFLL